MHRELLSILPLVNAMLTASNLSPRQDSDREKHAGPIQVLLLGRLFDKIATIVERNLTSSIAARLLPASEIRSAARQNGQCSVSRRLYRHNDPTPAVRRDSAAITP